jgi:disulfide bond formation protein DsbB
VVVSKNQWLWGFTLLVCIVLLSVALFYQHALKHEPCELCIYTRVWITGIAFIAVLGLIVHRSRWSTAVLLVAMVAMTVGLGLDVRTLLAIDHQWALGGACSFQANFPDWAPLDSWMPPLFEVRTLCQPTPLLPLGIGMADGLAAVCVLFLLLALYGSYGVVYRSQSDQV